MPTRGRGAPARYACSGTTCFGNACEATFSVVLFYSCFIGYSSIDQLFVDTLYSDLQRSGIRCWLATEDLRMLRRDSIRTVLVASLGN